MSRTPNRRRNLPVIAVLDKRELKTVLEIEFHIAFNRYAESLGYKVMYFHRTARPTANGEWRGLGPKGWPDSVCVKGPTMLIFELKGESGKTTPEQDEWLQTLANVPGVQCFVAKPRDAAEVIEILQNGGK